MTVSTFDPRSHTISMTPAAVEHARRVIGRAGSRGIRLDVRKSGCSGFRYDVSLVESPSAADLAIELAGDVTLFVDAEVLPMVRGTRIDYVTEGLNSNLRFDNPNAHSHCGCGESFAIDPATVAGPQAAAADARAP